MKIYPAGSVLKLETACLTCNCFTDGHVILSAPRTEEELNQRVANAAAQDHSHCYCEFHHITGWWWEAGKSHPAITGH